MSGVYLLSSRVLLKSCEDLERRETIRNVERANDALTQEITDMHDKSADWSTWDDTYNFMANHNKAYVDSNLSSITLKLDLMLFLDNEGRVFQSRAIERDKRRRPPEGEVVRHALGFDRVEETIFKDKKPHSGIVFVNDMPMLYSVRPILRTNGTGAPRGWLVFGLVFDGKELAELGERTHLHVEFLDLSAQTLPADCHRALKELAGLERAISLPLSEKTVAGYSLLRDFHGVPFKMVKITEPREIYAQGVTSVSYLLQLVMVTGVAFGIVALFVLEVSALSRVSKLSRQVEQIGRPLEKVALPGNDELSWLADKINGMLSNLSDSREELRLNNEELECIVRQLESTNAALENAVEGISSIDLTGRYLSVNAAFARSLGYNAQHMKGVRWEDTIHPNDHLKFRTAIEEMVESGKAEVEVQGRRLDGSLFFQEAVLTALRDETGQLAGYYCFTKDISERRELETRIEHQAFHDTLTGLPNRALFMDRLEHAQVRAKRHRQSVAVIFLDLDNFKIINDSLGHEAGDGLLIAIAERMMKCIRPEDTVARLGGDEFTVLLEELSSPMEALAVAQRIVEGLAEPILLPHGATFASGSIGIAFSSCGVGNPESLLRDADTAMYQAKAQGKCGYVLFDPSMNERAVERLELESGLRQALERGEFYLHYQPVVSLRNAKVVGMEALLRWNHPVRGMVSPASFIPIAEETGLIAPIGNWVLREACRQTRAWHDEFPDCGLTISVNVSGRQLQRPDIIETVSSALAASGLEPQFLKLEITESVLVTDVESVVARLVQLKALGIKLAIDDFGTGYSSMSSLSSYPVDTIKIDGSFTARLMEEGEAAAVVAAIVMLAKSLKLEITAEGVENNDQLMMLLAMGCHTAQGYLLSHPLSAGVFAERLAEGFGVSLSAA